MSNAFEVESKQVGVFHDGITLRITATDDPGRLFVFIAGPEKAMTSHYVPTSAVIEALRPLVKASWGPSEK